MTSISRRPIPNAWSLESERCSSPAPFILSLRTPYAHAAPSGALLSTQFRFAGRVRARPTLHSAHRTFRDALPLLISVPLPHAPHPLTALVLFCLVLSYTHSFRLFVVNAPLSCDHSFLRSACLSTSRSRTAHASLGPPCLHQQYRDRPVTNNSEHTARIRASAFVFLPRPRDHISPVYRFFRCLTRPSARSLAARGRWDDVRPAHLTADRLAHTITPTSVRHGEGLAAGGRSCMYLVRMSLRMRIR
ncbi:hypothetical protein C8Q79DRAFT_32651 [Trametes meyenii]|nr:hypothetical protein C8Q79DRAFT_32651 [Trametes meyenii]